MEPSQRPFRPTPEQLAAAAGTTLADVIAPGLRVLFVGINPGLYTAAVQHHFGRPGNRFWRVLHLAGFTDSVLSPFEDRTLVERGMGITNLVDRATAAASELTPEELRAAGRGLAAKVERWRPATVAVLGMSAYRAAFSLPRATIGRRPERLGGAEVWLLPNPSGLQARYQLPDLVEAFAGLAVATGFLAAPPARQA